MPGNRDRMILFLEEQGATVKKTKKGLLIWNNGKSAVVHNTPSDVKAVRAEVALFRQIGLIHPDDKRAKDQRQVEKKATPTGPGGYPAYLAAQKITPRIRQRMMALLDSKDWPLTVRVSELREYGANTETGRALYGIGYRYPLGKMPKGGYVWEAPEDIAKLHDERMEANRKVIEEPDVEVKLREEPLCQHPSWKRIGFLGKKCTDCGHYWEAPDPCAVCGSTTHTEQGHPFVDDHQGEEATVPEVEDLEFIDERDSWVVDMDELLGEHLSRMVRDRLGTLRAVGIDYEIRVWREKEKK